MARSSWKNINFYRKSLQLAIVAMLGYMVVSLFTNPVYVADFEAYCPFGGMQALTSFFVSGTLACSMTSMQIAMGVALVLGVIVFSKLFCSYICPIGTFTEWLGQLGEKMKMRYTIKGAADRGLRVLKYALLFVTFYFTVEASELFCREWDPFYAVFTGYGHDVNVWYASIGLGVVVFGSIFVRQFWCKYLCPLSAATNLFAVILLPVIVLGGYIALVSMGMDIHWVWPLAIVSVLGFAYEAWKMKTAGVPLTVIQRIEPICTGCKNCDIVCPMAIEVSTADKVRHIDCHLCTDCIEVCPHKGALTINKKNIQWFPAVATVGLIVAAILYGNSVQIPTITERWGSEEEFASAQIYQQDGLRSIKCFGSSKSFATQMKDVPGVLGVQTFVGNHAVKVWYDESVIDAAGIQAAMFSPVRMIFSMPDDKATEVGMTVIGVDKLFDSFDHNSFELLLSQTEGLYAVETEFGEPVHAVMYYNPEVLDAEKLKAVVESPSVTYMREDDVEVTEDLKFGATVLELTSTMAAEDFRKSMFEPIDWQFNGYDADVEYVVYEVNMPQAADAALAGDMPYLISHVSNNEGVVRFETAYEGEVPVARIYYLGDKTTPEAILEALQKKQLHVLYEDGDSEDLPNPFNFKGSGVVSVTLKKTQE